MCLVAVLGLMLLATGCKKENENEANTLNGTIWMGAYNGNLEVFTFKQSNYSWVETANGVSAEIAGSYTYNYPDVFFQYTNNNGVSLPFTGKISGNTMTLTVLTLTIVVKKQ